MTIPECYQVLGIDKTFDINEIKAAYRKQANLLHPDKNPDPRAGEYFMMSKEAYETLIIYIDIREKYGMQLGQLLVEEENEKERDIQERVRKAQEKRARKIAREQELIQNIYKKYTHTWRMYIVILLSLIALPVSAMLFYDFVFDGEWEYVQVQGKSFGSWAGTEEEPILADFYIVLRGTRVAVSPDLYVEINERQVIEVERTRFFREIKHIRSKGKYSSIESTPLSFINDAWAVFVILLILPIISFFFMKPRFVFVFFYIHYNLYIHPLVLSYILLGNARILNFWNQ